MTFNVSCFSFAGSTRKEPMATFADATVDVHIDEYAMTNPIGKEHSFPQAVELMVPMQTDEVPSAWEHPPTRVRLGPSLSRALIF